MQLPKLSILVGIMFLSSVCALSRELIVAEDPVQLTDCPDSPNCVSSQSLDSKHRVEPLRHDMPLGEALMRLRQLIEAMPRTKLIRITPEYLHVEFRSALFGFVDDVEFALAESPGVIHVRSASRIGYWDMGANRKRVERIRENFARPRE